MAVSLTGPSLVKASREGPWTDGFTGDLTGKESGLRVVQKTASDLRQLDGLCRSLRSHRSCSLALYSADQSRRVDLEYRTDPQKSFDRR